MKKTILACATVFLLLLMSNICYADNYLSINEVLSNQDLRDRKIEIRNNYDTYKPVNPILEDFGDLKIIILQKQIPEKEFTKRDFSHSQLEYASSFDDDFEGVDIGETRVWYRGDLMSLLPSFCRADSFENADILVIAENYYLWSGTLINTTYENADNDVIPDFDSTEELAQYLSTHQKKISSIAYYPVFDVYSLLDIYGVKTKDCFIYSSEYKKVKDFARNPEADLHWYNMTNLMSIIKLFMNDSVDPNSIETELKNLDFLPQQKQELWSTCLESKEYSTALFSIEEYFWSMAKQLKEIDPSPDNKEKYDMIISDKDYNALALFVDYCDYAGFDESMESIKLLKEYMATPDEQILENMLKNFIDYLNDPHSQS